MFHDLFPKNPWLPPAVRKLPHLSCYINRAVILEQMGNNNIEADNTRGVSLCSHPFSNRGQLQRGSSADPPCKDSNLSYPKD